MNRIFYIHSNIVEICCYNAVKESLNNKEKVIIITDRNCNWSFFQDKVIIYDFVKLFKSEDRVRVVLRNINAIKGYLGYRRHLRHLDKVVNRIVADEDFILYLPTMALDTTLAFADNKYCKGYYYVEEGSLSYRPQNVKKRFRDMSNQTSFFNIKGLLKRLLRIEDHNPFEIRPSFKGTISISSDAFPWNTDKEKIVSSTEECIRELKPYLPPLSDVIVTAWLVEDIDLIRKGVDYVVKHILKNNHEAKIGIKFHPKAITYNSEKISDTIQHIREKYDDRIIIIPIGIPIEILSLVYHPKLYSLYALSSLILYGLLLKSSEGYLVDNDENNLSITRIVSVEEYFKICRTLNYKKI